MGRREANRSGLAARRPSPRPRGGQGSVEDELDPFATELWGERLRKLALGATAALVTARAYWPSEPDPKSGAGDGLAWVLCLIVAAGVGLAALLVSGRFRFRGSWTDVGLLALVVMVASSANHAADRGPALNMAWEWVGLGIAYFLLRNLPRSRDESQVLVGCLFATTVAVAVYGLYQAFVELPALQARFLRDPAPMLEAVGVRPGTPSEAMFRDRLLYSSDVFSTFGLANSLAGFLVGPLVVALWASLRSLTRPGVMGSRLGGVLAAAPLVLIAGACLILTKSRSAWIGLAVGMVLLGLGARRLVARRTLVLGALGAGLVATALAGGAYALGRLDREVLTQSTLSLRYRWEFWRGAWGVITEGATASAGVLDSANFWSGVGPANFGAPYLRHKLPQSSEEIQDPHNLFLEVWATAGVFALAALLATLGLGLWNLLGSRSGLEPADASREPEEGVKQKDEPASGGLFWLGASASAGWVVVVALGRLNPFFGDLFGRWLILGGGWILAAMLGRSLWRDARLPAAALGAGVAAMIVNLLAAGGIGIPTVALQLWALVALGLNLADDRRASRPREWATRLPAFGLACGWAALIGVFLGGTIPYWRCQSALDAADLAMREGNLDRANAAYEAAIAADPYDSRPWLGIAYVQAAAWKAHGAKPDDERWKTIPIALLKSVTPPRNSQSWTLHRERAEITAQLLALMGSKLDPREALPYQANIVEAIRTASRLYPTNAELHARLAQASAGVSMYGDAASEAEEALRLDRLTPHRDKKLPQELRDRLIRALPSWKESAAKAPSAATSP